MLQRLYKKTEMKNVKQMVRVSARTLVVPAYGRALASLVIGLAFFAARHPLAPYSAPVAPVIEIVSHELSKSDTQISRALFAAQKRGEFDEADTLIGQLDNNVLLGHVLAERYLSKAYRATAGELVQWMENYHDHPQAKRIAGLARKKGAKQESLDSYTVTRDTLKGDGYIDHLGRTGMPDGWFRALTLWKEKSYGPAGRIFASVGDNEKLSQWQRAAGYYWAFRSEYRLGQSRAADRHLALAAEYPTTFYGMLAARQMGEWPQLAASAPYVPTALRDDAHVVRARALATIGQHDMAEAELRQLYTRLDERDRPAVLTLASEMDLSNLQVRLAGMKQLSDHERLFARYPMPSWVLSTQDKVDPALLLSIARQESVFRTAAISPGGAVGMMQMLPSTARSIERRLSAEDALAFASTDSNLPLSSQLTDSAVSVRLGAEYIRILSNETPANGDLIKSIASYNAGPGAVGSWQKASRTIDDPLLYIESIPYGETRNYVMQVLAHYWVYELMLGEQPDSLRTLAEGSWPQV